LNNILVQLRCDKETKKKAKEQHQSSPHLLPSSLPISIPLLSRKNKELKSPQRRRFNTYYPDLHMTFLSFLPAFANDEPDVL